MPIDNENEKKLDSFAEKMRKRNCENKEKEEYKNSHFEEELARGYIDVIKNYISFHVNTETNVDLILSRDREYNCHEVVRVENRNDLNRGVSFLDISSTWDLEGMRKKFTGYIALNRKIDVELFCSSLEELLKKEGFYAVVQKIQVKVNLYNIAVFLDWSGGNSQDIEQNSVILNTSPSQSGGCYIATCVYGSYDCPEVWTLR